MNPRYATAYQAFWRTCQCPKDAGSELYGATARLTFRVCTGHAGKRRVQASPSAPCVRGGGGRASSGENAVCRDWPRMSRFLDDCRGTRDTSASRRLETIPILLGSFHTPSSARLQRHWRFASLFMIERITHRLGTRTPRAYTFKPKCG